MDKGIEVTTLQKQGDVVYTLFWDSGGPFAGAKYEFIYEYENQFWQILSDSGVQGPFDTLEEALTDEFTMVTGVTEKIDCPLLSTDEVVARLQIMDAPGHKVMINGRTWVTPGAASEGISEGTKTRGPEEEWQEYCRVMKERTGRIPRRRS